MIELLTTADLAAKLGVRPATIREWVRQGLIPEIKISPKIRRFDFAEVLAALRRRQLEALSQQAESRQVAS